MTEVINFGSVYEMKQYMIDSLAPKFFDLEDVNQYNVGLLGYTTEAMAVVTEESFNAANTMFKEVFITRATFPETIFAKAGILGIDDIAAIPANVTAVLYVKKDDIISKGKVDNNIIQFPIDRDTLIDVDGIPFSLDYDIHVFARPDNKGDFVITAQYDMSDDNTMSALTHPFIKLHRTVVTNIEYVALFLKVKQMKRHQHSENLITSNNINFPSIEVEYDDMYAGMDVFYYDPETKKNEKLILKIHGAPPIKHPFIYYEHIGNNRIRLSFTTRDNYFRPMYNSELDVVIYTTTGASGNFKMYNGPNVNVINSTSERVDYDGNPIFFASVLGSSIGGTDIPSIEDLRVAVVEKQSTSGAYNTEADLELYLNNQASKMQGVFMKFIKRRDDLVERLFSCFGLFREEDKNYYQTNSLHLRLHEDDFDRVYDDGNRLVLRPGRMIGYLNDDTNTTATVRGKKCVSSNSKSKEQFTYSNPFLISMQKKPNSIAYYNNSLSKIIPLDYKYNDIQSEYQFIINNLNVSRNAIIGENSYTFSVFLKPNFQLQLDELGEPILHKDLQVILSFDEGGNDTKAAIMELIDYNPETSLLQYQVKLDTSDEITPSMKLVIENLYDVQNGTYGYESVPMMDAILNVSVLVKEEAFGSRYNPFVRIDSIKDHTMVAKYTTETEPVTLVKPMKHVRSRVRFDPFVTGTTDTGEAIMDYYAMIELVPLVSYKLISSNARMLHFLSEVGYIYDYIERIMHIKTTNYSIDMKFYNTYGKSRNFVVDEAENPLDRVNLSLGVQVAFQFGTILEDAVVELQEKIKTYIENVNTKVDSELELRGYNGIYMSNLIQQIENEYPLVRYMKFKRINEYDSSVQVIENRTTELALLTHEQRREYVPEFLTIHTQDITVDIL